MKKIFFLFVIVVFFAFTKLADAQNVLLSNGDSISVSLENFILDKEAQLEVLLNFKRNFQEDLNYIRFDGIEIEEGVKMSINFIMHEDSLICINFFSLYINKEEYLGIKKDGENIYLNLRSMIKTKKVPEFKEQVRNLFLLLKKEERWSVEIEYKEKPTKKYFGKYPK